MAAEQLQGLRLRKLPDTSEGERVKRYDPETGDSYLADPLTWVRNDPDTWVSYPWPLLGVAIEGDVPEECEVAAKWVTRSEAEGFVELEGRRVVHRPGGPEAEPWRVTHTFVQADAIVLHLVDAETLEPYDLRYEVVDSPDKWPTKKNEYDEGFGGDVRWYYRLRRER